MPILVVLGVSEETSKLSLSALIGAYQQEIARIKELGLKPEQVSVFFPRDLVLDGLGEEIIVLVQGLLEKPERTLEVINRLKKAIGEETRKSFPKTGLVEVFVSQTKSDFCWFDSIAG